VGEGRKGKQLIALYSDLVLGLIPKSNSIVDSQMKTSPQGVGLADRCRSQSELYRAMVLLVYPLLVVSLAVRTTV